MPLQVICKDNTKHFVVGDRYYYHKSLTATCKLSPLFCFQEPIVLTSYFSPCWIYSSYWVLGGFFYYFFILMCSEAISRDSWAEPKLSCCCRNSWKSASRCKLGPRAEEDYTRWMGSAAGGNKNPCRKWKYLVRNFSSHDGAVTESNSLQK